jgi:hypothetical protein
LPIRAFIFFHFVPWAVIGEFRSERPVGAPISGGGEKREISNGEDRTANTDRPNANGSGLVI